MYVLLLLNTQTRKLSGPPSTRASMYLLRIRMCRKSAGPVSCFDEITPLAVNASDPSHVGLYARGAKRADQHEDRQSGECLCCCWAFASPTTLTAYEHRIALVHLRDA